MSNIPEFCIESPCQVLGSPAGCDFFWDQVKTIPVPFESLYSGIYSTVYQTPYLLQGLQEEVQNDLSSLAFRLAIIQSIPYVLIVTVIILILAFQRTISPLTAITLFIILLVFVGIMILWLTELTLNVVSNLYNTTTDIFNENWDRYGSEFVTNTIAALFNPEGAACPIPTEAIRNAIKARKKIELQLSRIPEVDIKTRSKDESKESSNSEDSDNSKDELEEGTAEEPRCEECYLANAISKDQT